MKLITTLTLALSLASTAALAHPRGHHPHPHPRPAPHPAPAPAPHPGLEFLGETKLMHWRDSDKINVAGECPAPANKPIRAIKIEVVRNSADIDFLAVHYGNGVWDELPVRERFAPGSDSNWIDLNGNVRCVEQIKVIGDTDNVGGRWRQAIVRVYGSH